VKIGFSLPQFGDQAQDGARVAWYASEMEKAGADGLWVSDRLLGAVNPRVGYAGSPTIPPQFHAVLDPFALLAIAATATGRVRLGTDVIVAPWYRPVELARSLTTIDVVSGGRLLPGFGVGWSPEEYDAAEEPFTKRGARMDEVLDALEAIWTTNPASYHGKFVTVPEHHASLKPVQRPRPPIYLAGYRPAGLERVGRRVDGWLPVVRPAQQGVAEQFTALRGVIARAAEEAGRDPKSIDTIVRLGAAAGNTPELIAETVRRLTEETGVDEVFVDLTYVADSAEGALKFGVRVVDLVK
jgi:probable F420-dependent oxidoreductase